MAATCQTYRFVYTNTFALYLVIYIVIANETIIECGSYLPEFYETDLAQKKN